jgi:hypothetical protein
MQITTIAVRLAALFAVMLAAAPAGAACREDLVAVDQAVHRTRADLHGAATATPAVKCAAYRQHVAALTKIRDVFARCDTGANKAKNAAQVKASIADLTRQMQESCKK